VIVLTGRLPVGLRGPAYLVNLDAAPLTGTARAGLYFDESTRHALVPLRVGIRSGTAEAFRIAAATEGVIFVQQLMRAASCHSW
jgi:hypothetical protein